jgi:hypothetical protein
MNVSVNLRKILNFFLHSFAPNCRCNKRYWEMEGKWKSVENVTCVQDLTFWPKRVLFPARRPPNCQSCHMFLFHSEPFNQVSTWGQRCLWLWKASVSIFSLSSSADGKDKRKNVKNRIPTKPGLTRGCQRVYFQTKNPNLDKFWRALEWKMLVYLLCREIFYGHWGVFYDH